MVTRRQTSLASARADRRGHWPANVGRNPEPPKAVQVALKRIAKRAAKVPAGGPRGHEHSLRSTATRIGCALRTLRRWIRGEDWPSERWYEAIVRG